MSTSSISSSMLGNLQQFQQLGTDLSSGNLTAAQSDFAALLKEMPQSSSSTANSQSSNPLSQAISQLSQDLKSGNLKAAQQDYASLQQDLQSPAAHGHHHQHGSGGGGQSQFSQLFNQLGQDLQYGDLSSAQSTWGSMQQLLQSNSTSRGSSGTTYTPISVTA
ncbi:hypothetical protein SBA2_10016 [Acidobacteriia bacterium SbA2]|nr:hypothetical protein SBA2_10016 [Acidobacteriia bacterium SbA2]